MTLSIEFWSWSGDACGSVPCKIETYTWICEKWPSHYVHQGQLNNQSYNHLSSQTYLQITRGITEIRFSHDKQTFKVLPLMLHYCRFLEDPNHSKVNPSYLLNCSPAQRIWTIIYVCYWINVTNFWFVRSRLPPPYCY
jgi:hypothetical protein